MALGRQVPLLLPVLAVGVVALVVLDIGKTHPVLGARLRGGPTEGARTLSYRLELVQRHDDEERRVPGRAVTVEARLPSGDTMAFGGTLDAEGAAAVSFSPRDVPITGPVELRVTVAGVAEPVATALVRITRADWANGARRRGGWAEGRPVNGVTVRAAAGRGAFAVPFADPLVVDVQRAGASFMGTVSCERPSSAGAAVPELIRHSPAERLPVRTQILPLEHATSVPIVARDADGTTATLDVTLAVVPGALHAELAAEGVRIESPILRDRAYVAIVTETERVAGGTVVLRATDRGTASGVLALPIPPGGPLWAVVSSEPDLRSASIVGWPIRYDRDGEPPSTFDVPDVLVLDSVGTRAARELRRARRVRVIAGVFAAAAIALSALLVARQARASGAALEAHLVRAGNDSESTRQMATSGGGSVWLIGVAVLCLILAAALVGVFAAWS